MPAKPLRVAIVADRGLVPRFGLKAIDAIPDCAEIEIYSCTNSHGSRRWLKHGLYYALNLAAIRNPETRLVDVRGTAKRIVRTIEFESVYEGDWQAFPPSILERLRESRPDFALKLGMNLLRIPPEAELPVPILSFHHGDPEHYRGRPAGFWETAERRQCVGQVIQVLGNRLDAGRMLAFGETRISPHSYRATLIEAYSHSPLLIAEAVRNLGAGRSLDKPATGRNYRLPSNLAVARMVAGMAARYVARLLYGAFVEKSWRVSTAPAGEEAPARLAEGAPLPDPAGWRTLPTPRGRAFVADPFFMPGGAGLIVEAMDRASGIGSLLAIGRDGSERRISPSGGHFSYPCATRIGDRTIVLPEMAEWSRQHAYELVEGALRDLGPIAVEGGARLVDPTLFAHEGRLYLFANELDTGPNALFLWSAAGLEQPFARHPLGPIRISPQGSRMAGLPVAAGGRILRFGQDYRGAYGDGVQAFEIERLTPGEYRERPLARLRFPDRHGPHTLNFAGGEIAFDWYRDRVSPAAGLRRLRGRFRRRPA